MCSAGRVSSSVIQPRSFLTVQLCLGSCAKRQEEKGGGGEQKLNRGREGWGGGMKGLKLEREDWRRWGQGQTWRREKKVPVPDSSKGGAGGGGRERDHVEVFCLDLYFARGLLRLPPSFPVFLLSSLFWFST